MQTAGGFRVLARRLAGVPRTLDSTTRIRGMSTDLGPREKKLLEPDPALKDFKSDKAKVQTIKRFGDVLVLAVVAGSVYEIYYRVMERKAAQAEGSTKDGLVVQQD